MTAFTKDVDTAGFAVEVVERSHEIPVVVDFWAEWCGPCRVLSPMLEEAAENGAGSFELAKIDVDQNQALASQFGVQGIPTVVGFRDGQAVSHFTGAVPQAQLDEWLNELVPSEADLAVEQARDRLLSGDTAGAEQIYREVLSSSPSHHEAGTGLAALLISSDQNEEALEILDRLATSADVERLQAAARIGGGDDAELSALIDEAEEHPEDAELRIRLAKALAAAGDHEPALDHLLHVVRTSPEYRDEARVAMLDVFQVLGSDSPLTAAYRVELANTLF